MAFLAQHTNITPPIFEEMDPVVSKHVAGKVSESLKQQAEARTEALSVTTEALMKQIHEVGRAILEGLGALAGR